MEKNINNFHKLQISKYSKIAHEFNRQQKRDNRNHFNKIKAINDFLEIKNMDRVLEIGIGTGIHAGYILNLNKDKQFEFYGVDISKDMLDESKKKLGERCKLLCMTGEKLAFDDNFFDKIYISGSLHHFADPELGIKELVRVLKIGGKFCIMEPNILFPINSYFAHKLPEEKNMQLMKKSNFKKWLKIYDLDYKLINFAYTPPFPKSLVPVYNVLDRIIYRMPFLNNFSVMLFAYGQKL